MAKKASKKKMTYTKKLRKNFSRLFLIQKALIFAAAFAIAGVALLVITMAASSPYDDTRQASLIDNPQLGISYKGLKAIKKNANHPCKGEFEAEGLNVNGEPLCTHGPDPVPPGLSIADTNIQKRFDQLDKQPKGLTNETKLKNMTLSKLTAYAGHPFAATSPFPESAVPCTSGNYRIQLVFITNRDYPSSIPSYFRSTARRMESQMEYSALHSGTGSTNRHLRFVTDSNCVPYVRIIRTPSTYRLAEPGDAVSWLQNRENMKSPYIKFLIWNYGKYANFCGMAFASGDESPIATDNLINKTAGYAVVDTTCWGSRTEMHELLHTLGAVNRSAPHSNGSGHCLDRHDPLCYTTSPSYIDSHCTDDKLEFVPDCNHDDYFNTTNLSPTAYLTTHWNIANSPYLQ